MVGVSDFELMTLSDKMQLIRQEGHYLHYRIKGWCKINIYWLGSFYAEVWFLYNLKDIGLIRTYTKATCLDPYLHDLQVPVLFE